MVLHYKDKPLERWHTDDVNQWYRDVGLFYYTSPPAREIDGHMLAELLRIKALIEDRGSHPADWLLYLEKAFQVDSITALKFSFAFHKLQQTTIKQPVNRLPSYGC